MDIKEYIKESITQVVESVYGLQNITLEVQENKTDFEGDFTVVIFPLVKQLKKSPDALGQEIGEALINSSDFVEGFNVVKGFLNLKLKINTL